jgi:hypothetical protein
MTLRFYWHKNSLKNFMVEVPWHSCPYSVYIEVLKSLKKLVIFFFLLPAAIVQAQTKFGVMIFGRENMNTKIKIARELGVSYIRDGITMQNWTGRSERVDRWVNGGFKLILNVQWGLANKPDGTRQGVPYPTDTVQYKKTLDDILTKYKPEVVVIENEETVQHYHSGPIEDYINELTAAIGVAHSKGLKVTNGGITKDELALLVYNYYADNGMKKEADDFARRCLKPYLLRGDMPAVKDALIKARKLIEAYKKLPLDYVNVHLYEPIKNRIHGTDESVREITPGGIREIINWVEKVTGKKVMSNEFGVRATAPELVTGVLNEFAKSDIDYAIWWSGFGGAGAVPLHNDDGTLTAQGEAFKKFMENQK